MRVGLIYQKMCENGPQLCENLCEKNFPKSAKIGKDQKAHGKLY